jgi:surface carbohydrate biosynthesis protein
LKQKSVCLVVDNPLRDLNGLVLLAYQLAKRGMDAWLVPMYEQWNEIQAIHPDAVLLNYIRSNNRNHAMSYLRKGMMVGVLDTEGVGGRNPEEFAALVSTTGYAGLFDLYCLWGSVQRSALLDAEVIPDAIASLTGCPRYDFCAQPWRQLLLRRESRPYVLVNTNFPTINPRFSTGREAEIAAMVSAGFDLNYARQYTEDTKRALVGMIALLEQLLTAFPDRHFVLRPHPFESPEGYKSLRSFTNLDIRQEGTSVEWVAHADALIHLNCSTAVEARMLDVPALSPSWLDAPTLHVLFPSELSLHHNSAEEFREQLEDILNSPRRASPQPSQAIEKYYHHIDGQASARVADAVLAAIESKSRRGVPALPAIPLGFRIKSWVRSLAGTRLVHALAKRQHRVQAKSFSVKQVGALLAGIQQVDELPASVTVEARVHPHGESQSVLVRAA